MQRYKKSAFSLIEVIITIIIVSIIAAIAVSKLPKSFDVANLTKIRSDVGNIKTAIEVARNNKTIKYTDASYPSSLDNCAINIDNCQLFIGINDYKILKNPIISASLTNAKSNSWVKMATNKYRVFLNDIKFIDFTYTSSTGTFLCDQNDANCVELLK